MHATCETETVLQVKRISGGIKYNRNVVIVVCMSDFLGLLVNRRCFCAAISAFLCEAGLFLICTELLNID